MLTFEETGLEEVSFGDNPEDIFYVLVNKKISPNGINYDNLRLTNPRYFDNALDEAGCIIFLSYEELEELIRRKELDKKNMHQGLYNLAKREGLLP